MALTVTNTLVLLLTGGHYSEVKSLGDLPFKTTLFSTLLIVTILRFYHGNARHLDSVYGPKELSTSAMKPAPWGGLGIDFFVILAQSILFAVMSFYAAAPEELLILFTVLLASDVLWVLVVQQPSEDRAGFSHQRRWMLNNIVALFVLLGIYLAGGRGNVSDATLYAGGTVMLLNSVFDFVISWTFYFPAKKKSNKSHALCIFLAAPFTQTIDSTSKQVDNDYRQWLERVIRELERAGYEVISAHVREDWGNRLDSPATALKQDLNDLYRADAVVAHVGSPPSPGVQFELGVAASLEIPVVLVFDRTAAQRPYLNPALPAVIPTDILEVDLDESSPERIIQALGSMVRSTDLRDGVASRPHHPAE
ncbi:MAG: nucleoside 2-deoxyribosyltransferase [Chloroflexota bacterium]